ncbi:MAG: hypothetical protein JXR77_15790 [Lentisphaeria bacterium]|nr:hypothetical protein [Lentisphaeria bacterium]
MAERTVVITRPEYVKAQAWFEAQADIAFVVCEPDEASVAGTVRRSGARAVILGVEKYHGPLYEVLPRGGILSRFGVGHDGIDKARATAAGLLVANTPGVLEDAVAEHAMALMLGLCRGLAPCVRGMDAGRWEPRLGRELRGRRLSVVGCGAIGRRVARIASRGFGMCVGGVDPRALDPAELARDWGIETLTGEFAAGVAEADVVSLHVPSVPETRHLLCARTLAACKADACLVNTSRGAVVDECALYDALLAGRLGGAALDVFEVEPYVPGDPAKDLRRLPNVLLTPHVSSSTQEACLRLAAASLANVRRAWSGQVGRVSLVNPEVVGKEPVR